MSVIWPQGNPLIKDYSANDHFVTRKVFSRIPLLNKFKVVRERRVTTVDNVEIENADQLIYIKLRPNQVATVRSNETGEVMTRESNSSAVTRIFNITLPKGEHIIKVNHEDLANVTV